MIRRQLVDGLLQEVDIALQAGGPAIHRLFGRTDFDARNVLRAKFRRYGDQKRHGRRRQNPNRSPI
jgi:hypothetical protein